MKKRCYYALYSAVYLELLKQQSLRKQPNENRNQTMVEGVVHVGLEINSAKQLHIRNFC